MDLVRFRELKRKLLHDKELPPVWAFFLDHFGENIEFMQLGERTENEFLYSLIATVGKQLFGTVIVSRICLARLPEHQFIHGGFTMGGRVGGLIYFEDVEVGLLAVSDIPPGIETKYVRFSPQPLRKQAMPSPN